MQCSNRIGFLVMVMQCSLSHDGSQQGLCVKLNCIDISLGGLSGITFQK